MSRRPTPMLQRLMAKITVDPDTGCWNWTATKSIGGYGRFYEGGSRGRTFMAHGWRACRACNRIRVRARRLRRIAETA